MSRFIYDLQPLKRAKMDSRRNYIRYKDGNKLNCRRENLLFSEQYKDKGRGAQLKKIYNLSEDDYEKIIHEQGNKCCICEEDFSGMSSKEIHVDHIKGTKFVRGILCKFCNVGLGHFRDNASMMIRAAKYIEDNKI